MIVIKEAATLARYLTKEKTAGKKIGFVPTMGALHDGHLALVARSKGAGRFTVCSIFVNPTQFNNPADFRKYPNIIDKDIAKLATAGVDILFLPAIDDVYEGGTQGLESYDLGYLETVLEGKYRPGHFQGVAQVMKRLLALVRPHDLYMGLKDYQQCMVVKRVLEIMQWDIQFHGVPTVREADGLAMSSRNLRLTGEQREKAPAIYQTLQLLKNELQPGNLQSLKKKATAWLEQSAFKVDYVEIADADTLELVEHWDGNKKLVGLIAAFLGEVRLIDNQRITQA